MTRRRIDPEANCERTTVSFPAAMLKAMKGQQLQLGYPTLSEYLREVWKMQRKSEHAGQVFIVDHLAHRENLAVERIPGRRWI